MKKYSDRTRTNPLITLLMSVAFGLKLIQIESQSIWFDEGWSAYAAAQPDLITAANADATNPPLYYALMHGVGRAFGTSEFSLRIFSVFWGALLIPLAYQLGKRVHSRRAGIIAAALVGVSPSLWWASQEARMYTLMAVQVMIAALAWHGLLKNQRLHNGSWMKASSNWIALWVSELAILYTHNSAPVIVVWLNVITAAAWITARSFKKPDWRVWIAGQGGVIALWMPYFFTRFVLLGEANSAITSAPTLSLEFAAQVWAGYWIVPWERVWVFDFDAVNALTVILMGGALIGSALVKGGRWLALHSVLLTSGLIAALVALGNELHGRYLVMIAPLVMTAIAVGIAAIPMRVLRWGAAALAVIACLIPITTALDAMSRYRHDDARGMARFYAEHLTENDTVLAWSYADRYELAYYWDRLGVRANRVTLPEGADFDEIAPMLPTRGDVALNVWYTQRADYRGMMGCLLGDGIHANTSDETFMTYGMTTRIYRAPSLDLPEMQPRDIPFRDENGVIARVTKIGAIPATGRTDQAQCIPIEVTLERATDAELKAALIVLNPLGWEIARADAIIATANQRPTTGAAAGERLMAFPLIELPFGAPPVDYTLVLRLYDERDQPNGYMPEREVVDVRGLDAVIGTWTAGDWDDPPEWAAPLTDANVLTLVQGDLSERQVINARNGDTVRVTLRWRGEGNLLTLRLRHDETHYFDIPPQSVITACCGYTLDWREIIIPPDFPAGVSRITLHHERTTVYEVNIDSVPMVTDEPQMDSVIGADVPDVGELVGYNGEMTFSLNQPPEIELVWRAGGTPEASYTVFVQMLNASGQVIAQSDSLPLGGDRPTTGWREGEYLIDRHVLTYNDLAAVGNVTIIAGMYNPVTGERLVTDSGTDHVVLGQGELR